MEIVVDIQCFKYANNIIIKELAAVDVDGLLIPRVYVFHPPCAWNELSPEEARENSWLQRNYHGLEFDDIHDVFKELKRIGGNGVRVKFNCKGSNKKRILERYLDDVYNLEDMHCPSVHTPGFRRSEGARAAGYAGCRWTRDDTGKGVDKAELSYRPTVTGVGMVEIPYRMVSGAEPA
ncbi:hypothetical protein TSAR_001725 [Trichomalopsis sarcophagae]|uniref:Uncharacterized protein n=1 Tax=Trichomalopsis sarcophagae TaxID=543379 RepID=A0A232F6G3_9HYME|nr:hypothetical protein TSAR_001725 [Trichomalopsis sarcophagae]